MKGRILSLTIILMVIGSFGAVGTNFVNYNNSEITEYKLGEVIVGFHKDLDGLEPMDVEIIDSFEGHNIKNKIEILNAAVVQVAEGTELQIHTLVQKWVPFVLFKVHSIVSLSQVGEMVKGLSG